MIIIPPFSAKTFKSEAMFLIVDNSLDNSDRVGRITKTVEGRKANISR